MDAWHVKLRDLKYEEGRDCKGQDVMGETQKFGKPACLSTQTMSGWERRLSRAVLSVPLANAATAQALWPSESSPATSRAIHASPSPLLQQMGWELPVYPVKCGEAGVCVRI